jgi:predicted RND superfamily exporter protein
VSSIVEKYTAFLERRGRIVILGTVLVMIGAAFGIARLSIRTDFDIFMPPDSPHRVALDAMSE